MSYKSTIQRAIERVSDQPPISIEFSNGLAIALMTLYAMIHIGAVANGRWDLWVSIHAGGYLFLALLLLIPNIEIWQIGRDAWNHSD